MDSAFFQDERENEWKKKEKMIINDELEVN